MNLTPTRTRAGARIHWWNTDTNRTLCGLTTGEPATGDATCQKCCGEAEQTADQEQANQISPADAARIIAEHIGRDADSQVTARAEGPLVVADIHVGTFGSKHFIFIVQDARSFAGLDDPNEEN